jgi:hypothetical protein
MNISSLATGIYVLKIQAGEIVYSKKVVVFK